MSKPRRGRLDSVVGVPRRLAGDQGTAMLEFALLLPLLSLLVFGVIDIGRVYSTQNRLTNMAREGGAYAQYFPDRVVSASSSDDCAAESITSRARGEDPSLSGVTITVTDTTKGTVLTGCDAIRVAPGDVIQVKASMIYQPLSPFVSAVTGNAKTISGSINVVVLG